MARLKSPGTNYDRVRSDMVCTCSRFRLQSALRMPLFYWVFRKVRKACESSAPGLIKVVFLIESPRVCYVMALWQNADSIGTFASSTRAHDTAAHWAIPQLDHTPRSKGMCTLQWSLYAVSPNRGWDDLDLTKWFTWAEEEDVPGTGVGV